MRFDEIAGRNFGGSSCFCWELIVNRFGGSFCKEQIVESFAFAWDSWEASGRSLCCLERCTHTRLLCAAICAFCALFCFVQLPSPCARTATKKPTWLLCGAARPHAILYSGLGRKILSGIVVLFTRCGRRKVHNGKRGELLWEAAADIHDNLATSVQMYSTSELQ